MNDLLSVIIPVWNGQQYLSSCLNSLLAQSGPKIEIIVVDNASLDGSAELIATHYPQAHLIRHRVNMGFAGGCNAGLRVAQGDMLVFLNQDTQVFPGWASALVQALQKPQVGIVGCKIFYPDGQTIQHAGGWLEWPLALAHHYGQGEQDTGQWDTPCRVEYVTGAAMAFRRKVVEQVGALDEGFWPGYFEDADFCFRAAQAGFEIWYIPQAMLVHQETTATKDKLFIARAYDRGRLRFLLKHFHPQYFLDQVVPAERAYQLRITKGPQNPLRMAYLETIPVAATLLARCWRADMQTINAVIMALEHLYRLPTQDSMSLISPLREFKFHSTVPLLGPLFSGLRSIWYNVAARWAVRYLIQQQEFINQQQDIYIRSVSYLAKEIAQLILRYESGETQDGDRPGMA